jgi:hypothetical protein
MDQTQVAEQVVQTAHAVTVQPFVLDLIVLTKSIIMPTMFFVFFVALTLRALIYYTVKREESFAKEFEKRVNQFLGKDEHRGSRSFFILCKKLLEKTYYEMFEMRTIMKRRKIDHVMEPSDRIFLVQQGTAHLVRDVQKELKFVKYDGIRPPLPEIVKTVFSNNPCFTRVFGVLPVGAFNDFLNIIPGLFIVGGIFGTFLGIMQALPELGAMDIQNPESTKMVMDTFLAKIAFSMSTSTVGILLSVVMTTYNNFLSPERLFVKVVDRFERNLFRLWSRCDNNQLPEEIPDFDEHRDAIEALASLALDKELARFQNVGKRGDLVQIAKDLPKAQAAPQAKSAVPPRPPVKAKAPVAQVPQVIVEQEQVDVESEETSVETDNVISDESAA